MRIHASLLAIPVSIAAFTVLSAAPASAASVCAGAQTGGFVVADAGPVCVPTPVATVTDTITVNRAGESVTITVSVPAP